LLWLLWRWWSLKLFALASLKPWSPNHSHPSS
jgi:hypothetical protein